MPNPQATTVNEVFDLPAEVEKAHCPAARATVTECEPTNATPLSVIAACPLSRTTAPCAGALSSTVIL